MVKDLSRRYTHTYTHMYAHVRAKAHVANDVDLAADKRESRAISTP